ncbi:hypothetical protein AB6G31_03615 [Providencia hangzhouensis]|uniref:tail fiber/spike domain-containing protein n=1 Tax=Providencia hangzhouensis TaxID=3031799 RepID=UPI0034DDBD52
MRQNVKPTQEPVPSSNIKDLFFNSGLLDIWTTSLEHKYIDRFGNCHLTAAGMEWLFKELVEKFKVDMNTAIVAAGYITIDSFQQGADLPNNELTQRNHILRDEATGEYYRWDGDLPKQVLAGSTPQSTGGIGKGAWVSVGDASLRWELQKRFKKTLFASDFGAIDGANNTLAFQKLALACNTLKSHFKVIFDVSNSEIFDEIVNPTPNENTRYYQSVGDIFSLQGCSDFILDFTGCEMVTKRGLHYGSFHPLTGAKYDAVGNFTNAAYAAELGVVLSLDNCKNYTCLNFNANGNNGHLIVGGKWGDTGIQLKHIGIREFNCSNAVWQNRTCSYFGLDGTYIGGNSSIDVGGITVINEVCEYNGRQGFSFTGGKGIVFINPRWCYTGMGTIYSSPGAGIDIEPNAGFSTKSLKIINPCIVGNRGAGVLALGVSDEQTTNIVISGGEIVSTSPGAAFYANTPKVRMNIHDTDIHGSIRAANAKLTFRDCFISTLMKYNIQPSGTVMENIGKEAKFVNCKILATYLDALYITNGLFDSCDIEFSVDSPLVRSRAAVIGGNAVMKDTHISANYTNYPANINDIGERTFIDTTGSKLGINWIGTTKISGYGLAFGSRTGTTNAILGSINPDGTYLYSAGSAVTLTSVSDGNGAFTTDIPLGAGMFMITIHSFSSYPRLSFCVNQLSFPSNEQHAHGTAILSKTTANANITSSMIAIVDGLDVLRLTGVSDMTGVTCVISKLATSNLAGFTMVK